MVLKVGRDILGTKTEKDLIGEKEGVEKNFKGRRMMQIGIDKLVSCLGAGH